MANMKLKYLLSREYCCSIFKHILQKTVQVGETLILTGHQINCTGVHFVAIAFPLTMMTLENPGSILSLLMLLTHIQYNFYNKIKLTDTNVGERDSK